MGRRFGVNITRTITLEQTVYIVAKNDADAMAKVQEGAEAGRGGDAYVEFRRTRGVFKDAEDTGEITEDIQVDDAYEAEE